jgi:alpha-L-fucosidase
MEGKSKDHWESEKLIETVRSIQPDIIIDNRCDLEQDIWTPEQYQPLTWVKHAETGELVTWEACQTFSGSWGYHRDESTWKSPKMLIDMLVNTVCIGGNLLMNVGPTARGYLDKRAEDALGVYAEWMKYNSRSIYGCTMAEPEFVAPRGTRLTQSEDGKRLYIHLVEYPYAFLEFQGLGGKIDYAQFLHDGSEILYTEGGVDHFSEARTQNEGLVAFKIPYVKPNVVVPVIEVFLK